MKIPPSILGLMAAAAMSGCVANAPAATETCVDPDASSNTNAPPPDADTSRAEGESDDENETYIEGAGDQQLQLGHWCLWCGLG